MDGPDPTRAGAGTAPSGVTALRRSVLGADSDESLWWQTQAINHVHAAGLALSDVGGDDPAAVDAARQVLRRAVDDLQRALLLLPAPAGSSIRGAGRP